MSQRQIENRRSKAQLKARAILENFWPQIGSDTLWNRKIHRGFTTIPRTMPLIMSVIDSLTKNTPAGQTYFALWCRAFDEPVVVIENPLGIATDSGFSGERALTTWKARMKSLQELGFIDAREGSAGIFHYVLVRNPHKVLWELKEKILDRLFVQVLDRALDVGAIDMTSDKKSDEKKPETNTANANNGI
jgi:hypothetical protein